MTRQEAKVIALVNDMFDDPGVKNIVTNNLAEKAKVLPDLARLDKDDQVALVKKAKVEDIMGILSAQSHMNNLFIQGHFVGKKPAIGGAKSTKDTAVVSV